MDTSGFTYVDVVGQGCEGWLNLFFNDHCIALVDNLYIANKIRQNIPKRDSYKESSYL